MHHLLLIDRADLAVAGLASFPFGIGFSLWRLTRPASPAPAPVAVAAVQAATAPQPLSRP
jgi:hypothetical protein